jgi:hypothetical protein
VRLVRDIPFRLNVIDCFTRNIVELDKDSKYLTLSYLWGGADTGDLMMKRDRHILEQVRFPAPATIEDAMQVVRAVGQRYLWVDRYCIPEGMDGNCCYTSRC